MKKYVIHVFSFILKMAIPLFSALIGLKIVEQFNFFQFFHLINDADKAFDICTTVYFAIIDVVLLTIIDWIQKTLFTPQIIQVTLSKPGDLVQNNSIPDLMLISDKPCEALLTVRINAKKKNCENLKLLIEGVNFATMQLPKAIKEASVDKNGNIEIKLVGLFGNQEQADTTQTFKILFSREPVSGVCQSVIYPKLNTEPWFLTFVTNKMIIRAD